MSGSLTSALDLTRTGHLGQKDGGSERADSFDAAEQLMIAGELLVRADLLGDELSKRALSALSVAMMRLREQDTLGATPSRRFFSACSMRESSSRRRTKARSCATSRVGGCHGAGRWAQTKSAIMDASTRAVLLRLPALRAYCLNRRGLSKLTRWHVPWSD